MQYDLARGFRGNLITGTGKLHLTQDFCNGLIMLVLLEAYFFEKLVSLLDTVLMPKSSATWLDQSLPDPVVRCFPAGEY